MKTVVVVGVGALGSHVVQFLRNAGVNIRVIDFDKVEMKNVTSQFHGKTSVGKFKVASLQQTMNFLYGSKLDTISNRLTQDNVKELLGRSDLVIDCLDNGNSRRIVQRFVRENSVPCIHGALAAEAAFGRAIWDESFQIDDEPGTGAATCENGEHLPFIALTSAFIARAAQEYLSSGRKVGYQVHPGGATRV